MRQVDKNKRQKEADVIKILMLSALFYNDLRKVYYPPVPAHILNQATVIKMIQLLCLTEVFNACHKQMSVIKLLKIKSSFIKYLKRVFW